MDYFRWTILLLFTIQFVFFFLLIGGIETHLDNMDDRFVAMDCLEVVGG